MVSLVIEEMGKNVSPSLFKRLSRRRRVRERSIDRRIIERTGVSDNSVILIGPSQRQRPAILEDDGVEPIGMLAFSRQPLEPQAISQQQMIERAVHAFEKGAAVAPIVSVTERQRRLVKPSVGPKIVGGALLEMSFH